MYSFYELLWSFTLISLYFEIGEEVTQEFDEISYENGEFGISQISMEYFKEKGGHQSIHFMYIYLLIKFILFEEI